MESTRGFFIKQIFASNTVKLQKTRKTHPLDVVMEPTDGEVWVVLILPDLRGVLRGQRTCDERNVKEEDTRRDTLLG